MVGQNVAGGRQYLLQQLLMIADDSLDQPSGRLSFITIFFSFSNISFFCKLNQIRTYTARPAAYFWPHIREHDSFSNFRFVRRRYPCGLWGSINCTRHLMSFWHVTNWQTQAFRTVEAETQPDFRPFSAFFPLWSHGDTTLIAAETAQQGTLE